MDFSTPSNPSVIQPSARDDDATTALHRAGAPRNRRRTVAKPARDFVTPPSKRERRAVRELDRRTELALNATDPVVRTQLEVEILEIQAALRLGRRSPAPSYIDFFQVPFVLFDHLNNPIGKGTTPAANLASAPRDAPDTDLSRIDPVGSSFWRRPSAIAGQDLRSGFGRAALPDYAGQVWHYSGPKQGFGCNAGFRATSKGAEIKVKFAEVSTEPFNTRIFWALGYHTEPTDYVPAIKLRYDRRFFTEFNRRKDVSVRFGFLWLVRPYVLSLQPEHDPFGFIHEAILRDGRRISGQALKQSLLRDPRGRRPELSEANYRADVERDIACLITVPASVQPRDPASRSLGPWAFDDLGHENLRELRGMGLLAAWLGWFDCHADNNRLKIVEPSRRRELRHVVADLGGGLGSANGVFDHQSESPSAFGCCFTRGPSPGGNSRKARPFRITGYRAMVDNLAFERMTMDDARWMARLIGQLTDEQIREALIASGFNSVAVHSYSEKLISRRNLMLADLGLSTEFGLPAGVQCACRSPTRARIRPTSARESFTSVRSRNQNR
jgi:hypothetical protein